MGNSSQCKRNGRGVTVDGKQPERRTDRCSQPHLRRVPRHISAPAGGRHRSTRPHSITVSPASWKSTPQTKGTSPTTVQQ
ncbi:hypothetical protein Pmani_004538 [Petrolisthes manimaculis]|uniref:Uncharacterized protein n=1 Tax=Petrolisthes manimaculis TaxID=1843537 RepID=A0AAE1UHH5_9EUCA|nr:hypothetical protein Pmani_004538 [Petrolisthes manimaculis]